MSLIFRVVAVSRGAQRLASSAHLVNFNLDLPLLNGINCRCKIVQSTSAAFSRDYSTRSNSTKAGGSEKNDVEVVYKGMLTGSLRRLKIVSLLTSAVGIGLQPVMYNKMVVAGEVSAMTFPLFGVITVLAVSTPLLLHAIAKRYIISVEYDHTNDKYTATSLSLLALNKRVEFTPDDVTIPTAQGLFTNCAIKGKSAFLDGDKFTDPSHYIRIMGYDKPLEIGVESNEADSDDEDWSKNNPKKTK